MLSLHQCVRSSLFAQRFCSHLFFEASSAAAGSTSSATARPTPTWTRSAASVPPPTFSEATTCSSDTSLATESGCSRWGTRSRTTRSRCRGRIWRRWCVWLMRSVAFAEGVKTDSPVSWTCRSTRGTKATDSASTTDPSCQNGTVLDLSSRLSTSCVPVPIFARALELNSCSQESTEVLSPKSALFTFIQADSWDEHRASLPPLTQAPVLTLIVTRSHVRRASPSASLVGWRFGASHEGTGSGGALVKASRSFRDTMVVFWVCGIFIRGQTTSRALR